MITRDEQGVPHVQGSTVLEVAREQGRATARDRAWQLEVERRRGEGTCAEVFGAPALEWDVLARRADLPGLARRAHARLSPEGRAFNDAYVEGVNDVLPRPWSPWTPLAVFAAQHLLFSRFPTKLWQHHVASCLGADAAAALDLLRGEGIPGGSNAVVVAGSLTASGLPLLAGDPHRVIESPGCYAQVRLVCTDPDDAFDVVGLAFAGVPGVQHFGHATAADGGVAWGVTNAVADDEDLVPELLERRGTDVVARGAAGWEPVARTEEVVRVRTGPATFATTRVEVLVTARGPVVAGGPDDDVAFALRTPADVLGDLGLDATLPLLRARTAADVTRAFGHWVAPVDNLLVADTRGRVEHRVVGRVPVRCATTGTWTGWVADLPRRTGALLVTANDRATADFARIATDFAPPHRARRLTELVGRAAAAAPLTAESLGAALADDRQVAGQSLLDVAGRLADLTAAAAALRDRLRAWDRRMAPGSVEAALFAAVRAAVVEEFSTAPLLAGVDTSPFGELYRPWFDLRGRVRLALPTLLAAEKPFGVDPQRAVAAALEQVAGGSEPAPWGEGHVVVALTPHQQFGLPPGTDVAPVVPVGGDDDCVLATRALGGTGACVHGPVARWVWDLAGADRWVVPLGASGDPASPHHHDQQATWASGATLPVDRNHPMARPMEEP